MFLLGENSLQSSKDSGKDFSKGKRALSSKKFSSLTNSNLE